MSHQCLADSRRKTLRIGDKTPRGYEKAAFLEPWDRYLPATSTTDTTIDTPQPDSPEAGAATVRNTNATPGDVADVLPLVAEAENAESPNAVRDVVPVADVSLQEAAQNLIDTLSAEIVTEFGGSM